LLDNGRLRVTFQSLPSDKISGFDLHGLMNRPCVLELLRRLGIVAV